MVVEGGEEDGALGQRRADALEVLEQPLLVVAGVAADGRDGVSGRQPDRLGVVVDGDHRHARTPEVADDAEPGGVEGRGDDGRDGRRQPLLHGGVEDALERRRRPCRDTS